MLALRLVVLGLLRHVAARSRTLLDKGWKFHKLTGREGNCSVKEFPEDTNDQQCFDLMLQAQVTDVDWCMATCCGDDNCEVWQWCPGNSKCGQVPQCFTGPKTHCIHHEGWVSRARTAPAPPSPTHKECDKPECKEDFDDAAWLTVDLPHDMLIDNVFTESGDKSHGYLPYSAGWYRLHFEVPSGAQNQTLWIEFDGVQRDSNIFLNGQFLGSHASGYTSFRFDATALARPGQTNVLAVSVDARKPDSWWYDGGGIYRHVWMVQLDKLHLAPWGVYLPALVTGDISPLTSEGVKADAVLHAQATVQNNGTADAHATVRHVIKDPSGGTVATVTSDEVVVKAGASQTINTTITLQKALLWSPDTPALYSCETTLLSAAGTLRGPAEVETVWNTFGVRKIEFDVDKGLLLNSLPVKVKGFANHQDFAGVGVAVPDSLQAYRVTLMKKMGSNAWRTAHNPPTPALLDECDRLGMLVWDEHHRNKLSDGLPEDTRLMVLRDRNHPSIIMWSVCNEVLCENWDAEAAKVNKAIIKELDPLGQRPVTAAMNGGYDTPFADVLDVIGINYHIADYDEIRATHPGKPIIGSETSSDYSDRSIYANDPDDKMYVSAYDVNYPGWGNTAEDTWCTIASKDWVAGGFYWTAFDYKGEPTPYGWPNVNSHFGVIDIAGFPKDNYHYHRSVFFEASQQPVLHILPHWNWNSSVPCRGLCRAQGAGKTVDVWAYTNGDFVELFLNNRSLGRQAMTKCRHVNWTVPYEAGELRAEAYLRTSQYPFAVETVVTTGPAVGLAGFVEWPVEGKLRARSSKAPGGSDTALLTIQLVDSSGRMVPTASAPLQFSLSGPGKIIGLGNGDPSSHESDKPTSPMNGSRSAWNGLARVVVQADGSGSGSIVLKATGEGLTPVSVTIPVGGDDDGADTVLLV